MNFEQSQQWWERASRVIPLGTQTLSKSPTQWVQGVHPIYLSHGKGAHVWDVDGNEFIDYPMGLGPVILGHAEPVVNEAIAAQLDKGITLTLMNPLEVEVAERIIAMCPGVEAVRFGKSGSDVLSGAIRAARAYTGRDHVLVAGYHGWHDWYIGTTARNGGVPIPVREIAHPFPFDDLDALGQLLQQHRGQIAAITLEPSGAEVPSPGFLQRVVDLAHEHGAVAIFDEIITGFRLAPGGARQRYGVIPDISCYGKALGNGMPISAVAGGWPIMSVFEDIFFSGTHGGEMLSLAAAKAVLDTLADGTVLHSINARGQVLLDGIAKAIARHGVGHRVRVSGEPERAVVSFPGDDTLIVKSFVQQTMAQHAMLFNGGMFICARHSDEDIAVTLVAFEVAFAELARTENLRPLLLGEPVQPVFRNP